MWKEGKEKQYKKKLGGEGGHIRNREKQKMKCYISVKSQEKKGKREEGIGDGKLVRLWRRRVGRRVLVGYYVQRGRKKVETCVGEEWGVANWVMRVESTSVHKKERGKSKHLQSSGLTRK